MNEQVTKHTPGPWTAEPPSEREYRRCWSIWPTDASGHVAHITQSSRDESNARLIAAAPELLDALRLVLAHDGALTGADWTAIRAAIAKAEGEG